MFALFSSLRKLSKARPGRLPPQTAVASHGNAVPAWTLGAPFSRKVSPCSPCPLVARDRRHGDQRYSESRLGKAQARRCS
jgi:hypothetical protein